jgi:hypothetical protein
VTVIGTSAGVKLNTTGRVGSVEGGTGGTASAGIAVGVSPGPAACGVNGFPDPLSLFRNWTYSMEGFAPSALPFTSAGQFAASIGGAGSQGGILKIANTSSQNGLITRQELDAGRYSIYPDCSGGTLTFNLSTRPLQFDFWFVGFDQIAFVSTTGGFTVHGTAVASATSCPANPLDILNGTWTFSTEGFSLSAQPFTSAGRFVASSSSRSGNQNGFLAITSTSSQNGLIVSQEADAGAYQIYPDCSGGTLTFNLSTRPLQFDFWFATEKEIRFVSTTGGATIRGAAAR